MQGSGRQQKGALINLVAFYVFAMPLALFLGFYLGWGVIGLFAGMGLGPVMQTLLYGWLVLRTGAWLSTLPLNLRDVLRFDALPGLEPLLACAAQIGLSVARRKSDEFCMQTGKERHPRLQPLQPRRRRLYWRGTPWTQQGIQRMVSGSIS